MANIHRAVLTQRRLHPGSAETQGEDGQGTPCRGGTLRASAEKPAQNRQRRREFGATRATIFPCLFILQFLRAYLYSNFSLPICTQIFPRLFTRYGRCVKRQINARRVRARSCSHVRDLSGKLGVMLLWHRTCFLGIPPAGAPLEQLALRWLGQLFLQHRFFSDARNIPGMRTD